MLKRRDPFPKRDVNHHDLKLSTDKDARVSLIKLKLRRSHFSIIRLRSIQKLDKTVGKAVGTCAHSHSRDKKWHTPMKGIFFSHITKADL